MRLVCFYMVLAAGLIAQDTSVYKPTEVDINGNRVSAGPEIATTQSKNGSESGEFVQSINGEKVPLQKIEERVVSENSSSKVTERIVRRYDLTGNPLPPEKVMIEETKGPNGSSTVQTTKYKGDLNGEMQVSERSTTQTQDSSTAKTSQTLVERPTLNGGFETVQKTETTVAKQPNGYEEASITYRQDPSGNLYPAVRRVTDHTESGNSSSDNVAEYEVGPTGDLELHGQKIVNTHKGPNGSEEVDVDVFGKNVPGIANPDRSMQLMEHQVIERRKTSSGAVVETVNVRRPTVSDPNKLGPPKQLSETICQGKCDKP